MKSCKLCQKYINEIVSIELASHVMPSTEPVIFHSDCYVTFVDQNDSIRNAEDALSSIVYEIEEVSELLREIKKR